MKVCGGRGWVERMAVAGGGVMPCVLEEGVVVAVFLGIAKGVRRTEGREEKDGKEEDGNDGEYIKVVVVVERFVGGTGGWLGGNVAITVAFVIVSYHIFFSLSRDHIIKMIMTMYQETTAKCLASMIPSLLYFPLIFLFNNLECSKSRTANTTIYMILSTMPPCITSSSRSHH